MGNRRWRSAIMTGLALSLAACGAEPEKAVPLTAEQSAALKPKNIRLAGLYEQSCKACHTVKDTGAPLTGDRTQWEPRWQKGMPVLVKSAVAGVGGMPAGGQCFSCTPQDFEALIRFMADHES